MYQDIVLSPLFIKSYSLCPSISLRDEIEYFLKKDTLLIDFNKVITQEYSDIINELNADNKSKLDQSAIASLLLNLKYKTVNVSLNKRILAKLSDYESEKLIVRKSKSIWEIVLKENELERYVEPNHDDEIRNRRYYLFNVGEEFDFSFFIKKFIKDAEYIDITDEYIFRNNFNFADLKTLIDNAPYKSVIRIYTVEKNSKGDWSSIDIKKYQRNRNEIESRRNNFIKINPNNVLVDFAERTLETDKFSINLGHLFGHINRKNRPIEMKHGKIIDINCVTKGFRLDIQFIRKDW